MEKYYKCSKCWNEFDYIEVPEKKDLAQGLQLEACPYCGTKESLQELLTDRVAILQALTHFFKTPSTFVEEENAHYFEKVFAEQHRLILKLFTPIGPKSEEVQLDELSLQRKGPDGYKPMGRLSKVGKILYLDFIQDPVTQTSYLAFKIEKQSWETVMILRLELYSDGSFFVHFE
jgi:DNA-directed RNA polymerase subunit RPC12/RpoP